MFTRRSRPTTDTGESSYFANLFGSRLVCLQLPQHKSSFPSHRRRLSPSRYTGAVRFSALSALSLHPLIPPNLFHSKSCTPRVAYPGKMFPFGIMPEALGIPDAELKFRDPDFEITA